MVNYGKLRKPSVYRLLTDHYRWFVGSAYLYARLTEREEYALQSKMLYMGVQEIWQCGVSLSIEQALGQGLPFFRLRKEKSHYMEHT